MCQEPVIWSRTQVALGVLPYLVLVAVVVIDVMAGHSIGLLALLSLGPAFAAVVGGLIRMIIVSCLALALCLFLGTAALFDQQGVRRASPPGEIEEIHRVHEAIADAIIAGDTSLAQHRMLKHLNTLAAALGA